MARESERASGRQRWREGVGGWGGEREKERTRKREERSGYERM